MTALAITLLASLLVVIAAFYRAEQAHAQERTQHRLQVDRLALAMVAQSEKHSDQMAELHRLHHAASQSLLQRIQAPEAAVVEHQMTFPVDSPVAVPPDNDEAWWAAHDTDPLIESKEDLAMRLASDEDRVILTDG